MLCRNQIDSLVFDSLFDNISKCNKTEIWFVVTVVCSSEVLCFYCHWLC
jgi:hypothetical protein